MHKPVATPARESAPTPIQSPKSKKAKRNEIQALRNKAGATANASKTVGLPTLKSFNTSLKANWSSVPNNSTRSRTTAGFNWDCNCEFGYFYCSVLYCYKNCHGVLEIPDGGHRRREGGRRRGTEMPSRDLTPDAFTFAAAITACGGSHWELALGLLHRATRARRCDAVACAAGQSACSAAGRWRWSLQILAQLPDLALQPKSENFLAAISACEKAGRWQQALHFAENDAAAGGGGVAAEAKNCAMAAMARRKRWRQAIALLTAMGSKCDVVSYSSAIAACASAERWAEILQLLQALPARRLEANQLLLGTALRGVVARWQPALCLFQEMQSQAALNLQAFCDLFAALARAGRGRPMLHVAAEMEAWLLLHLQ
ncbi:unnamed protein product [Effrenium voratum]|nr:unnamed protein product [Effrenium voratum]